MVIISDFKKRPFVRLFLLLASGICLGYHWPIAFTMLRGALSCWVGFVLLAILLEVTAARKCKTMRSVLLQLLFFTFGFLLVNLQDWRQSPTYFEHIDGAQLLVQLTEEPSVKEKSLRFPVTVLAVIDKGVYHKTQGLLMVTLARNEDQTQLLAYGDQLLVPNRPTAIPEPYNPGEFDYRTYLKSQRIYKQLYVGANAYYFVKSAGGNPLIGASRQIRNAFVKKFAFYLKDSPSFDIAVALILGFRKKISPEIQETFATTGVVHILSVSGLHVSLVFALFSFLLQPLDQLRFGKYFRLFIIGIGIWAYAFLTGLAPPILRAAIMISFFLFSIGLFRRQDNLNTLFASAFFILLIDSRMLFNVGFQLSYAAVWGIFTLYPIAVQRFQVSHKFANSLLKYCYLSIAAQLFTAPLALYYFNQFPTYFLIGNLCVAIPIIGIMYTGIALALIPFEIICTPLAWGLDHAINLLIVVLQQIEQLPFAAQQGIHFDAWQVAASLLCLLTLLYAYRYRSKVSFWLTHALLFTLLMAHSLAQLLQEQYTGVKVYNVYKGFAVAHIRAGEVHLLSSFDSLSHPSLVYAVHPDLKSYSAISKVHFTPWDFADRRNICWQVGDFALLVMQEATLTEDLPNIDLILWRNNPKNLDNLAQWPKAMHLLDGSSSDATLAAWQSKMQTLNVPYYSLKNNFAYVWTKKH